MSALESSRNNGTNAAPKRRLLISLAHPDDESFGLGALIGKYVAEGVEVYYLCATDGDVGTVSPELLEGYNSVRELRLAELDRASEILGFKKVFKLGYKDSGMMGSETTKDPDCLWYAGEHHPEDVVRRVVEVIREVQPQVIITFNKYGGYGHPDHIAIQRATTEAFTVAADASYETGKPTYAPQKLYYNNIPKRVMQWRILQVRLRRENPRQLGRNKDIDIVAILEHIEPGHARVDIGGYYHIWEAASAAHVSQGGGAGFGGRRRLQLPKWTRRYTGRYQRFTRVSPKPARDVIDEYDLFSGIKLDTQIHAPVPEMAHS